MATIHCRQLTFGYPGNPDNVFTDLNLTIDTEWRAALVGRNGRGKTTLLRLLARELLPDAGHIEQIVPVIRFPAPVDDPHLPAREIAKQAIGPFRQWERDMEALLAAGDDDAMFEYAQLLALYQEAGGYEVDANLDRELAGLGIDEQTQRRPFETLSGGEQTRVLLAPMFAAADRYALIDEPTNHLDLDGRRQLGEYLATKPGFLLVSHDRTFLDASCDHVIALNQDNVETERTSFSAWRERYFQRRASDAKRNVVLKRQIVSFEKTAEARRTGAHKREAEKAAHVDKGFIGARAARQMKKAIVAEKRATQAADDRRATLVNLEKEHSLKLKHTDASSRPLIIANNLSLSRGGRPLLSHLSFSVSRGDRLAIIGPNGCGKSSLLDQITDGTHDINGSLTKPAHVSIARAHQQPTWIDGLLRDHLIEAGYDESRFRQILSAMGVGGSIVDQPIERLSHGQQKKIDLCRTFINQADVLIWDEPLNFMDVDARERIEDVILRDEPTLIFVEHDATFIEHVATDLIDLGEYVDF